MQPPIDDARFQRALRSDPGFVSSQVAARRIATGGAPDPRHLPGPTQEDLAAEECVTLTVDGMGSFTFLCTPRDAVALALGFAFTEGLIEDADDVLALERAPDDPLHIAMRIEPPSGSSSRRNLIITGACGLCGARNVDALLAGLHPVGDTLRVPANALPAMARGLRAGQGVFSSTGGAHGMALFTPQLERVALAEDIGRHTALDKALGLCLLHGRPTAGLGVMLSGRVSYELVAKCARAGVELMAAVSAPSTLAGQAAEAAGITLAAFVRGGRATIYTNPQRVQD